MKIAQIEEWKSVSEFPDYQVSNHGNVRRISKTPRGRGKTDGFLSPAKNGRYLQVNLWNDGRKKSQYVHRLVARAFIPNPQNKPHVCHFDGNGCCNSVSNLRWGTAAENNDDIGRHGRRVRGEKLHMSKLTEADVLEIRRRYKPRCPVNGGRAIAKDYKVNPATISYAVSSQKSWAWLK